MRILSAALGIASLGLVYACGGGDQAASGGPGGGAGAAGSGAAAGHVSGGSGGAAAGHVGGGSGGAVGSEAGSAGSPSAGAGAEAGNAGESGATGDSPLLDVIDPTRSKFLDYGKLRIGFKQAVDATTLEVKLAPAGKLTVTHVSQVDATTADVSLGYYHLPRDYELTVAGALANEQPFTAKATLPGSNNGARVGFLSQTQGSADIAHWTSAPVTAATPRDAADGVCQSEAEAAGFKGTFVALLSAHASYDAGCRAFGLDGLLLNHCGQAVMPVDHAPWLDVFGLPMVNGATNLVASDWDTAIGYRADGSDPLDEHVWTGTLPGAVADASANEYDCGGWTKTTGSAEISSFTSQYLLEYGIAGGNCADDNGLICLQVGGTFFAPNTLHLVAGKRAFVSKGTLLGAMSFGGKTGIDAADALCQSEASGAGYANAAKFRAYLGTLAADPMCHVLGASGRVADKCGLSAWPSAVWRRADDFPVAAAAELVSGKLMAALSLASDQSREFEVRPWTAVDTKSGETTCADWTSADAATSALVGYGRSTSYPWSRYSSSKCSVPNPLFCFEQ